ncbi:MAG: D-amino-acid transaminase [Parvibaculaceae bacterium]|nr:D-amino-acid transaminase [Parvibaculaceae bacterium]
MSRVSYVNGRYVPHAGAYVHIDDRGYQFADAVYEVIGVSGGFLIDEEAHLARLFRSLGEIRIPRPFSAAVFRHLFRELVRRNRINEGMIYLQVSRGVAPRDHVFPKEGVKPSVVATARRLDRAALAHKAAEGISVISAPDNRWGRVDIKTTGLLPNLLARQTAREQGAQEVWFVDREGFVTEGGATNAWIVDKDGTLITRPLGPDILGGVTRETLIRAAQACGVPLVERAFTLEEAKAAREAFSSASTYIVMPVVAIDGQVIGNGVPGSMAQRLREAFEAATVLS